MQAAAREEILANGGSISHHHGGENCLFDDWSTTLFHGCKWHVEIWDL